MNSKNQGEYFEKLVSMAESDMATLTITYWSAEDCFECEYHSLGEKKFYRKRCHSLEDFFKQVIEEDSK